jgi:hypothetical protein
MQVLAPSVTPASKPRVSFAIDTISKPTLDTSLTLVTLNKNDNLNPVKINGLGSEGQYTTTRCFTAVDYNIMSTFASLLPSLQLAFFSKPKPEEEEPAKPDVPGPSTSADTQAVSNTSAVERTPTASTRPTNLRQPSSVSSAQSAGSPEEDGAPVEGLVWKDGQRVRYDADGNVRGRKEGKRRTKERQSRAMEVSLCGFSPTAC